MVEIVASYDPPSTFTLSPPSYRAASPLSLTCEVQGLDDHTGLLYDWSSSVCAGNCFSKLGTSKTVSTDYLHSYDTGVHTCMVYDTLGCKANASISIKVVGKAIIIVHVISSAAPPLVPLLPPTFIIQLPLKFTSFHPTTSWGAAVWMLHFKIFFFLTRRFGPYWLLKFCQISNICSEMAT